MNEKVFVTGLFASRRETAPDYVVCSLSIKVSEFAKFVKEHAKDDYLNIDIMKSKEGKIYAQKNTFEPKKNEDKKPLPF
jgi:hypothetical protein